MFGIILPIANQHSGDWYPPKSTWSNSKDVRGTYAYQVFTALGMFLGKVPTALQLVSHPALPSLAVMEFPVPARHARVCYYALH